MGKKKRNMGVKESAEVDFGGTNKDFSGENEKGLSKEGRSTRQGKIWSFHLSSFIW